ncbi:MAG: CDP-diacylglycerol--serine O-phosphatidyltransferase [Candidatus Omnitrophica bacterium]|nr:CDP-diacylglycerol--serine O-phosphatidyltransferase [Candidatus Omnitrophota bacterium]MDD5653128.1 CDP-diacylglycerol--serine O-phosphatidyltransferase [Candidatus Omnitrophota bacterium]
MNYYNFAANLLTGLSLFGGFVSIIFSLESHFTFASWAIICSVIFDGLDGQVARKNPAPSSFGEELDSLVDVISFGVAPSILGYVFIYQHFHFWATLALFVYLCCSVFRLAKYNITAKEELKNYFLGLPTTVSGGALAAFILIYRRYTQLPPSGIFVLLVLLLAVLMVSKVKYLNLDYVKEVLSRSRMALLAVLAAVGLSIAGFYWITGVFLPEIGIFAIFLIYLIFSPFMVKLLTFKPR